MPQPRLLVETSDWAAEATNETWSALLASKGTFLVRACFQHRDLVPLTWVTYLNTLLKSSKMHKTNTLDFVSYGCCVRVEGLLNLNTVWTTRPQQRTAVLFKHGAQLILFYARLWNQASDGGVTTSTQLITPYFFRNANVLVRILSD